MKYMFLFCALFLFNAAATPDKGPKKVKLPKAYVYVPSGTEMVDGKKISVAGFFMQAWEVSNLEYREFLYHLKASGRTEDYEKARVRPEGWRIPGAYMEPFVEQYHQHPAYENYPVVNITREAAQLYCQWLQETLQARLPDTRITVRLPQELEWAHAARAGHADFPYPNGHYVRNDKGQMLYNFRVVGDEVLHRNPETGAIEARPEARPAAAVSTTFFGPAPAKALAPNDYGLYNMSGNVAEMLAEDGRTKGGCFNSTGYDIRIDGPDEFAGTTGASPYIGFRPVISVLER